MLSAWIRELYKRKEERKNSNSPRCICGCVLARCVLVFFISSITYDKQILIHTHDMLKCTHAHARKRNSIMIPWITKEIRIVKSHVDVVQSAHGPCFASIVLKNQAAVEFFCCRSVHRRICVIQIRHFLCTTYIQMRCDSFFFLAVQRSTHKYID